MGFERHAALSCLSSNTETASGENAVWSSWQVCDAPRRPGLHAHYNDACNQLGLRTLIREDSGNLWTVSYWGQWQVVRLSNEECLVGVVQHCAPITSLLLVHTARRCYRQSNYRGPGRVAPLGASKTGPK